MYHFIELVGAGLIAGLVNSLAGGGSFLVYPLLIGFGLPPIIANATTTISIWPGGLSSAYGYKKYIKKIPRYYFWLLVPGFLGGLIGAIALRKTSNNSFKIIVPWLILLGVVLLILQPEIHKWLKKKQKKSKKTSLPSMILVTIALFIFSIYGGYFGAGFGIIMLALLGFTKLTDIHQMNGLKNLTGAAINIVASIYFICYGLINWRYAIPLVLGTVVGGYFGAKYSVKLPTNVIRLIIIIIGLIVTVVLFSKY